jgi:hypothetical protein
VSSVQIDRDHGGLSPIDPKIHAYLPFEPFAAILARHMRRQSRLGARCKLAKGGRKAKT